MQSVEYFWHLIGVDMGAPKSAPAVILIENDYGLILAAGIPKGEVIRLSELILLKKSIPT